MHERRRDARVDAAAQAADDPPVADLRADALGRLAHERRHRPVARAPADVVREVAEDVEAVIRVRDFRMEEQRVEPAVLGDHRGDGRVRARRGDLEAGRRRLDEVAVAGPHPQVRRNRREERRARLDVNRRQPELAVWRGRDLAAERVGHQLHAVADAEHRHARLVDARHAVRRACVGDALRPARQHDPGGTAPFDLSHGRVERQDLRVDRQLTQAARNQLRELRSEIEDDKSLMIHLERAVSGAPPRVVNRPSAATSRSTVRHLIIRRATCPHQTSSRVGDCRRDRESADHTDRGVSSARRADTGGSNGCSCPHTAGAGCSHNGAC
jgi:hypothetical protein